MVDVQIYNAAGETVAFWHEQHPGTTMFELNRRLRHRYPDLRTPVGLFVAGAVLPQATTLAMMAPPPLAGVAPLVEMHFAELDFTVVGVEIPLPRRRFIKLLTLNGRPFKTVSGFPFGFHRDRHYRRDTAIRTQQAAATLC